MAHCDQSHPIEIGNFHISKIKIVNLKNNADAADNRIHPLEDDIINVNDRYQRIVDDITTPCLDLKA